MAQASPRPSTISASQSFAAYRSQSLASPARTSPYTTLLQEESCCSENSTRFARHQNLPSVASTVADSVFPIAIFCRTSAEASSAYSQLLPPWLCLLWLSAESILRVLVAATVPSTVVLRIHTTLGSLRGTRRALPRTPHHSNGSLKTA